MAWKIRKKEIKGAGKEKFHLIDEGEMVRLLETFYPKYDTELSTLPHLTRIRRKYFFPGQTVKEKGKDVKTDDDAYDAEVMQVLRCLSEVKTLTGLAFHSYNQKLASHTFSNIKGDFEVDWILINNAGIFVIEVGLATNCSSPETIIGAKVYQIIRKTSKNIELMIEAIGKKHLLEKDIKYWVALPNVSIQQLKVWMQEEDHQTRLENFEPGIFFFTQETLIRHNLYRGTSLEEIELEQLLNDSITDTTDTDFKYIASLIMHSNLATRTPDGSNREPKPNFNFEHPEDLVVSPEQQLILQDFISGKHRQIYLIGDAGTGKTTVLQLLLVYYAGKKSAEKNYVMFGIPENKWAFSQLMEKFVEDHCDQHLVQIVNTWEQFRDFDMLRVDMIFLLDEFYGSLSIPVLKNEEIFNPRVVFSIVKSGDGNLDKQVAHVLEPFMPRYFLRLSFRSSSHLFSPAAKLKRSIAASSVQHYCYLSSPRTFGVFYSGQTQLKISYTALNGNVREENLVIVYGNAAGTRIHSRSTAHYVAPEMDVEDLDFTGIEVETVAIVLEPKLFESGSVSKKQRLFLYNAMTRARSDVVILSSHDVIRLIQSEIELDESDRLIELIQQGKTVPTKELWRYYDQFDEKQRKQFQLLVALSCNRELVKNFLSPLRSQEHEHDSVLASFFSYALLQQEKSVSCVEFIDYLTGLFFHRPYWHKNEIIYAFWQLSLNFELVERYGQFMGLDGITFPAETDFLKEFHILAACVYGNLHLLQQLLEDFTDISPEVLQGSLYYAIHLNNAQMIRLLLPKIEAITIDSFAFPLSCGKEAFILVLDAFPNLMDETTDEEGMPILHQLFRTGNTLIVEEIIRRRPAALSQKTLKGYTPFDFAFMCSKSGFYFAVENYWEDLKSISSYYPLGFILSALGELEKLKILLLESPEHLCRTTARGDSILSAACQCGNISVVKWLILKHPEIISAQPTNEWPISWACLFGHLDIVELLLNFEKQMLYYRSIKDNWSLLHFAALGGVTEVAQFLLVRDERQKLINSLDNKSVLPLAFACSSNKVEMVKFLCSSTPEISNEQLIKVIFCAAKNSQSSIIFCLLEKFGSPKMRMEAWSVVEELVRISEPVFFEWVDEDISSERLTEDDFYLTILFATICEVGKMTTIIEFAKKYNARILDPRLSDYSSLPLLAACRRGRLSVVTFLATYYPLTLRQQSHLFKSPLQVAADYGCDDVVHYLCRYHLLSVCEHNLLDYLTQIIKGARSNGHDSIVNYLQMLLMPIIMILVVFLLTWHKIR